MFFCFLHLLHGHVDLTIFSPKPCDKNYYKLRFSSVQFSRAVMSDSLITLPI